MIAAEHNASRLVIPVSQSQYPLAWRSRQGKAVKALEKLAGKHVPMSLKQLEKAVNQAEADYNTQLTEARALARKARAEQHDAEHVDNNLDVDEPEQVDSEDLEDSGELDDLTD